MRTYRFAVGLLVIFFSLHGLAQAFVFTDPTQTYSTLIEDQWVFQAHQSSDQITVFYGEGDYDLFYIERLGRVPDTSSRELGERTLDLYQGPGGLQDFQLEKPLEVIVIDGHWGWAGGYSYADGQNKRLWEFRIFLLLPEQTGFSLTLSSDGAWVLKDPPILENILSQWRWLF